MDLFGVVSFIYDIEVRMSDSVTFFSGVFQRADIMNWMLVHFQTIDNLSISINRDRCFQEPFSCFTCSSGIAVVGVRAGEPG